MKSCDQQVLIARLTMFSFFLGIVRMLSSLESVGIIKSERFGQKRPLNSWSGNGFQKDSVPDQT